ncbi:sensor histidine kinase [Planomonospora parontospora]|uniref:sensor histidine kinase n=1 Tax=Planomonospora parontospora TaxID=58119 RepID=UPI0016713B2C|nr:sensor histidine kinase [Planomonospora parontospora]GGL30086.1 two-component sensor histidine kinase [Planomonospora parontospora subsp. antibiotica]GII17748.1 two-component sensor histidine kinase [Planomonospora parontospora subsp. antibiotica]
MQWSERRLDGRSVTDTVVAVAVALIIRYAFVDPPGPSSPWPAWSAWPAAVLVSLPIAVRRRRPRVVLALACATAAMATMAGAVAVGAIWLTFTPTVLVLYLVAATASIAWSAAALAACLSAAVTSILVFYAQVFPGLEPAATPSEIRPAWPIEIGVTGVLLTAAWAVGAVVRWKRNTTARLVRHLADTAVTDERRRIARELHDIIGHSMSLITVKATVANHVADARPQEVRAALAVIEQTSRSTLAEIHRVLDLLRADGDPHQDPVPVPGMADLPELAAHARSAGVEVDLAVRGESALPAAVAMSVYRIVQQALTNVVTHVGPTRCAVTVDVDGQEAAIEVVDDGPRHGRPPRADHGGHGLIGMRERTRMYGGTFEAGPRPEGGFRVAARLPYGPDGTQA